MITDDDLDRLLMSRAMPAPPANFTARVMAQVRQDRWQVEEAMDLGFNLALAAGVFLVVSGALGLLWSAGLLGLDFNLSSLAGAAAAAISSDVIPQLRTVLTGGALLTTALALWWWAEARSV